MSNLGSLPCGKALNGLLESSVGRIWLAWSSLEEKQGEQLTWFSVKVQSLSVFSDLITICLRGGSEGIWTGTNVRFPPLTEANLLLVTPSNVCFHLIN